MKVLPLVALLLLLATAGCSSDDEPGAEDRGPSPSQEERLFEHLSGSVRVATSHSTQPFVTEAAANFEAETDVQVETNEMSSRAALARLCAAEVAMAAVDRPLGRELRDACRRNQVDPIRVDLGWLVVAVVASPGLDLDCLSTSELRAIWRPGSQVDRYELYGSAPGTTEFELFTRRVVGREGAIRRDWMHIEDPSSMREALAIRERTLAFLNREAVYPIPDGLRAVGLGADCVRPTVAAVRAARYPLSRPLHLYVRRGALDALRVRSLARFTVENYTQFVATVRTIVPADQAAVERSARGLPHAPVPGG